MPEELLDAIRSGDVARVRALLEGDSSLANTRDDQGLPAVLVALYHRQPEVCAALLNAGPELTVLEAAATGRLTELRAHLAADPAALNARSPEGFTPLHLSLIHI